MLNNFFAGLLIFSFVVGQLVRLDFFGIFVPLLDASVFLFVLYHIISKNFLWEKYFKQKYLIIFISTLLISNLINIPYYTFKENIVGGMYLIRLIIYSFIVGVDVDQIKQFNNPKFINIIGIVISLIGILQFVFLPDLRFLQYQNWDDHLNRITFPYLDPSFTGIILLIFAILNFIKTDGHQFVKNNIILFLELIAIFLTFSRATWLVTVLISLIYLFTDIKNFKKKIILLIAGFSTISIIAVIYVIFNSSFISYGNRIVRKETILARFTSIKKGIQIWQKNKVFGIGFNNYKTYQLKHNYFVKNSINNKGEASIENSYIFVLASGGIIGFISYLFWILNMLHISKRKSYRFSMCFKYMLFSIFIGSLFNNIFFYPFILLIVFLAINFIS